MTGLWDAVRQWETDRDAAYTALRAANQRGVTGADLDAFTAAMDASEQAMRHMCEASGITGARHVSATADAVWVMRQKGPAVKIATRRG